MTETRPDRRSAAGFDVAPELLALPDDERDAEQASDSPAD